MSNNDPTRKKARIDTGQQSAHLQGHDAATVAGGVIDVTLTAKDPADGSPTQGLEQLPTRTLADPLEGPTQTFGIYNADTTRSHRDHPSSSDTAGVSLDVKMDEKVSEVPECPQDTPDSGRGVSPEDLQIPPKSCAGMVWSLELTNQPVWLVLASPTTIN
jgi:hypothetical protein